MTPQQQSSYDRAQLQHDTQLPPDRYELSCEDFYTAEDERSSRQRDDDHCNTALFP
jgi:hypothetical protein